MNLVPSPTATMTSLEIAEVVGKRHDNVKRTIETLAEGGLIVRPQIEDGHDTDTLGRPRITQIYRVGERDSYVVVARLSPEVTAKLVDFWQKYKNEGIPDFTNPAIAARAWAEQFEARQLAERTKAQIGSRREATAMATASAATRKVGQLEIELDRSHDYASVKRMEHHYQRSFPWRPLKKFSEENGLKIIGAFDANYGKVNTYHADAWRAVYEIDVPAGEA